MAVSTFSEPKWWKESTIYQIYPASFYSTGSGEPGWGDINGITSKLDYLKDLGVDIVWVSPIYRSPQVDMGYDISDYNDIEPKYGTLSDVDDLIAGLKKRDMKLMMDLVVNHTSDQHSWFLESRSSKTSSKRDWYIWQPPKYAADGTPQPPNNWAQILGEANSAWTWDEHTQEYFLSLFTPEQPDLNWRNPAVREAVHDILRFWLDRGASGFRMDVINLISKVEGYPDAEVKHPEFPYQSGFAHFANGPELHNYLQEMNREVLSQYDTITVGEMPGVRESEEVLRIVNAERKELNMIFIFDIVDIDNVPGSFRLTRHPWTVNDLRRITTKWQTTMQENQGWNSVFIENHDNPRSVSRYTDDSDQYRDLGAELLAMMQTTLSGTLYVYQGEELGMKNLAPSVPIEDYKDIESINFWKKAQNLYSEDEHMLEEARKTLQQKARDHSRTPVQWTDGPHAGFCPADVQPWMRVNDDYKCCNAAAQQGFEKAGDVSVWQFWKRMLEMRRKSKGAFVYGKYEVLREESEDVLAYKKTPAGGKEAFVVVLNFSGKAVEWRMPQGLEVESWVIGNYDAWGPAKAKSGALTLKPWEGVLGAVKV